MTLPTAWTMSTSLLRSSRKQIASRAGTSMPSESTLTLVVMCLAFACFASRRLSSSDRRSWTGLAPSRYPTVTSLWSERSALAAWARLYAQLFSSCEPRIVAAPLALASVLQNAMQLEMSGAPPPPRILPSFHGARATRMPSEWTWMCSSRPVPFLQLVPRNRPRP